MKAIKTLKLNHPELVENVPIPSISGFSGYALVKTSHVGVQRCDIEFSHNPFCFTEGITIGCDFSGTVLETDPSVIHIKKGDRVGGAVFATNRTAPNSGVWAEYILAKADGLFLLDNAGLDDARGATLAVGVWTTYVSLYGMIGLPLPGTPEAEAAGKDGKGPLIFISGGATCAGMWMIQCAKLSGCRVIATASPRNHELLRELGADTVVDYNKSMEESVAEILAAAGEKIATVIDCVTEDTTSEMCDGVMARGAKYYSLTMSRSKREDVESMFVPGQLANGEYFILGGQKFEDDHNFGNGAPAFFRVVEKLMREGKIRPPRVEVSSGWDAIFERMKDVQEGKQRAVKYVVDLSRDR